MFIPQREWSEKDPQTIERSLHVYKPTQNTICGALNNSLLLSFVCKGWIFQLNNLYNAIFSLPRVAPYFFPRAPLFLLRRIDSKRKFTGYFTTLNLIYYLRMVHFLLISYNQSKILGPPPRVSLIPRLQDVSLQRFHYRFEKEGNGFSWKTFLIELLYKKNVSLNNQTSQAINQSSKSVSLSDAWKSLKKPLPPQEMLKNKNA